MIIENIDLYINTHPCPFDLCNIFKDTQLLLNCGAWIYDEFTNSIWVSEGFRELSDNINQGKFDFGGFMESVHHLDKSIVENTIFDLKKGKCSDINFRKVINGNLKIIRLKTMPLYSIKGKRYLMGVVQDITDLSLHQNFPNNTSKFFSVFKEYLNETSDCFSAEEIALKSYKCINELINICLLKIIIYNEDDSMLCASVYHGNVTIDTMVNKNTVMEEYGKLFNLDKQYSFFSFKNLSESCAHYYNTFLEYGSIISVPVKYKEKTIAILLIGRLDGFAPVQEELILYQKMGSCLALQLSDSLLYSNMEQRLDNLSSAEDELRAIFLESSDFIAVITPNGKIRKVNDVMLQTLGYKRHEIFNTTFWHLLDWNEEDKDKLLHQIKNYGVINNLCIIMKTKLGNNIYTQCNMLYSPEKNYIIITAKNITSEIIINAQKRKLEESLTLEIVKSQFFTNITHELKTPLNIILSSIQVLKYKLALEPTINCGENEKRLLGYIEQNAYRLLKFSQNVIDSSKTEVNYLQTNFVQCDIVNLLLIIVSSVEHYANSKKISLSFIQDEDYLSLVCDPEKIDRIMLNLLSNAIKNTDENGSIIVRLTNAQNDVAISVEDNGIGIPEDLIPTIFQRFSVKKQNLSPRCDGAGMGLSIVKSLVELHGGKIWVKSKVGVGSTFTFTVSKALEAENTDEMTSFLFSNFNNTHKKSINLEFSDLN